MRLPHLLILISLTALVFTAAAETDSPPDFAATAAFIVHPGLVYSTTSHYGKLDLYLPRQVTATTPCVIIVQGGGFRAQNGKKFRPFAEHLAHHGIAAALIGYRGQPDHTYRDTIADVKTAVRFVRKIAPDHGLTADKVGAMGRSAGATIVALVALANDSPHFETTVEHAQFSSRIDAVVGISGVYDFVTRFEDKAQQALQPNLESKRISNSAWIGAPYPANQGWIYAARMPPAHHPWLFASPALYLDPQDPPVLLLHCLNDSTVPWLQSQDMFHAMVNAKLPAKIILRDEGGHAGPADSKELMVTFFRSKLID